MQRPGAVVTASHRNAMTIHDAHRVMWMHPLDGERHRSGTSGGVAWSEDVHSLDGLELFEHPSSQLMFVLGDGLHPDAI